MNASLRSYSYIDHLNHQITVNDLLGLSSQDGLKIVDNVNTTNGLQVWKLVQNYKNIPVFDTCITVVALPSSQLTGVVSGSYIQGLTLDAPYFPSLKPTLSKEKALEIAMRSVGHDKWRNNIHYVTFLIEIYVDSTGQVHPIYEVDYLFESENTVQRPAFLLHSHTGSILLQWSKLDAVTRLMTGYGGNKRSGQFEYSGQMRATHITQEGDHCFFENKYAKVIDVSQGMHQAENTLSFHCCEDFNDSTNDAHSPARDALFYASSLWSMFEEWYQTELMYKKSVIGIHYNMDNAFWDGHKFNFGDGSEESYPYTVADVVGHELAHAFTDSHSRLLYFGESGAMNEAFSDMTGETLEAYLGSNDWSVGRYALKDEDGFRYMDNPHRDNMSVSHYADYSQSLDPHYGSGIYNRIFYVIVKHFGVNIKDAYHAMLLANRMFWHSTSNFTSGACDVFRAAYYLALNLRAFQEAFQEAGIKVCSLLNYIHVLSRGEILSHLTVAPNKKPLFIFEPESFTNESIWIWTTTENGQVWITVFIQSFQLTFQTIAKGVGMVNIKTTLNRTMFIELSEKTGEVLKNVQIQVTSSPQEFNIQT